MLWMCIWIHVPTKLMEQLAGKSSSSIKSSLLLIGIEEACKSCFRRMKQTYSRQSSGWLFDRSFVPFICSVHLFVLRAQYCTVHLQYTRLSLLVGCLFVHLFRSFVCIANIYLVRTHVRYCRSTEQARAISCMIFISCACKIRTCLLCMADQPNKHVRYLVCA